MKRLVALLLSLSFIFVPAAFAARRSAPTGKEISDKAKATKFDTANATTGVKAGKKVKFTPARMDRNKKIQDLENGEVVGLLETELKGDETPLPPGRYNVFLAKVGNNWRAYAESGGKIVAEGVRVRVEESARPGPTKPEFRPEGWCFWLSLGWWSWAIVCF